MRKKLIAVAAASVMVAAAAAGIAGSADAQTKQTTYGKQFPATLSPTKSVKPGTVLTLKSSKATPNTPYYCVIAAANAKGVSAPDLKTMKVVKSNAKGKITCKIKYEPFTGTDKASGKKYHCAPKKADKKAGIGCMVALADQATIGLLSAAAVQFYPTK